MAALEKIIASATRILTPKGKGAGGSIKTPGTSAAWDMFETVPEVGTFADWVSNAMSGATLFAGRRGPDGSIQGAPAGSRAAELVSAIAGGPDGQGVMLGEFGTQLAVAGEGYLVIIPNPESDNLADDRWVVLSTEEATVQRGKIKAVVDGAELEITEFDPDNPEQSNGEPVAIRIWKASPRRHQWATSPVLRALPILEELRLLNAAVAAIARSRITGRGVLLVPAGARFPAAPGTDEAEDSLLDTFIEVASTAIREPESAAATVPIVLEIPSDLIGGVKWLEFSSEFDAVALQLRDEAIRRFATGADVPAEILMGLGDASHWGAWAITAEALKMGAEPRLAIVCNALTTEWLRPILESEGDENPAEWLVWYDTSQLRSSSNKGASALDAYDKGLINGRAARRELGFTEADAPGAQSDGDTAANERTTLPVNETQAPPAEPGVTDSDMAASLARLPQGSTLDDFTAGTSAALAEAVDGLVWSALISANRKMLNTPIVPRPARGNARNLIASGRVQVAHPVSAENVTAYRLLEDAWVRVPAVAARYGLDAVDLTGRIHSYVVALLLTGGTHEFDNVPRMLAQMSLGELRAEA